MSASARRPSLQLSTSTPGSCATASRCTCRTARRFPAFLAYLLLIRHARAQVPERFAWRDPPYEYERVKLPFDILCGTDRIRLAIESGVSPRKLAAGWAKEAAAFRRRRAKYLLY